MAAAIQEVSRIVASAGGINAVGSKYDMGKSFRGFSATLDKELVNKCMPRYFKAKFVVQRLYNRRNTNVTKRHISHEVHFFHGVFFVEHSLTFG